MLTKSISNDFAFIGKEMSPIRRHNLCLIPPLRNLQILPLMSWVKLPFFQVKPIPLSLHTCKEFGKIAKATLGTMWLCTLLLDTWPVSYINCTQNAINDNAMCAVFSFYPHLYLYSTLTDPSCSYWRMVAESLYNKDFSITKDPKQWPISWNHFTQSPA